VELRCRLGGRFRLHLGHALALQLDETLKLLDALLELGKARIGFTQGLVAGDEIFLEGLQPCDGFLATGRARAGTVFALGDFELIGGTGNGGRPVFNLGADLACAALTDRRLLGAAAAACSASFWR
jgi:hypothetical protein